VSEYEQRPPDTPEGVPPPREADGVSATGTVDPYEILGVRHDASQTEIEDA